MVFNILLFPHITVWGSCFSLGSRRSPPSAAAAPLTHSLTLTHSHSVTLTHSLTVQIASWLPLAWQAQYTEPPGELRRAWAPLGPRLPFAWQAQYTEPPGGAAARVGAAGAAAAFGVADAVHRASWRSCGARGRRWGRGCLSHGRRSTQSLLEELRRAWAPLGPRLPFAWQVQYTEPPGGAAARVGAAGAAAAFCMAGAVHRASWRTCGARGRRWGRGCLLRCRCSTQSLLEELRRAWAPLGPRLPFAWQAQYTEPPGGAAAHVGAAGAAAAFRMAGAVHITTQLITTHHNLSHTNSSQLHFSHLTHHSSTAHHNSSQLHFSQVHFSSQLITTYHIPTHHSSISHTSLLTPHLSHHNFSSQLITTYHIPTHHSSTSHTTSHTSLITSELITTPLLTPDITRPLLTPHFSHLPEVHIKLRYMKPWHVGLSGPLITIVIRSHFGSSCHYSEQNQSVSDQWLLLAVLMNCRSWLLPEAKVAYHEVQASLLKKALALLKKACRIGGATFPALLAAVPAGASTEAEMLWELSCACPKGNFSRWGDAFVTCAHFSLASEDDDKANLCESDSRWNDLSSGGRQGSTRSFFTALWDSAFCFSHN